MSLLSDELEDGCAVAGEIATPPLSLSRKAHPQAAFFF